MCRLVADDLSVSCLLHSVNANDKNINNFDMHNDVHKIKAIQIINTIHISALSSNVRLFISSKQVFGVSPNSSHTGAQPSTPLVDCLVNDVLPQTKRCRHISNVHLWALSM